MTLVADAMWGGCLTVWQPARGAGYRFNLDPVLLAGFVAELPGAPATLVELGAGCGIMSLMLASRGQVDLAVAVERQDQLARCIARNIEANALGQRMRLLHGDLRTLELPRAEIIAFNPPYYPLDAGRASPEPGRDAGRRELHGTLEHFVAAAARARRDDGHIVAILPPARRAQWHAALAAHGLAPQRERPVLAHAGAQPNHWLVQGGAPAPQGCQTPQPLVVHSAPGTRAFTPEVAAYLAGP